MPFQPPTLPPDPRETEGERNSTTAGGQIRKGRGTVPALVREVWIQQMAIWRHRLAIEAAAAKSRAAMAEAFGLVRIEEAEKYKRKSESEGSDAATRVEHLENNDPSDRSLTTPHEEHKQPSESEISQPALRKDREHKEPTDSENRHTAPSKDENKKPSNSESSPSTPREEEGNGESGEIIQPPSRKDKHKEYKKPSWSESESESAGPSEEEHEEEREEMTAGFLNRCLARIEANEELMRNCVNRMEVVLQAQSSLGLEMRQLNATLSSLLGSWLERGSESPAAMAAVSAATAASAAASAAAAAATYAADVAAASGQRNPRALPGLGHVYPSVEVCTASAEEVGEQGRAETFDLDTDQENISDANDKEYTQARKKRKKIDKGKGVERKR